MLEIVTKRLGLRPVRRADKETLDRWIFNDPEIMKGFTINASDSKVRKKYAELWCELGPEGSPNT